MSKHKRKGRLKLAKPKVKVSPKGVIIPERPKLMWAYGSNLSFEQMAKRCPSAKPFAPLHLSDGVLTFRGYADVERRKGGVIAGGLWRITRSCERALDIYEGVLSGVYEKRYLLLEVDGVQERCLYYRMLPNDHGEFGVLPPWDSYLKTIEQGYRDFKLDTELLDEALARSWGEKEKTEDVMRRWHARGKPRLARPDVETELGEDNAPRTAPLLND